MPIRTPRGAERRPHSQLDWRAVASSLDASGYALVPSLLTASQCRTLVRLYAKDTRFRSRVVMEAHGFGKGEYKYFADPLPVLVRSLRRAMYPGLAAVANAWREALGEEGRFPATLDAFVRNCHEAGQRRPTPLLLKYGPGDFNCLHRDLYGPLVFPLQMTVLLSRPEKDFTGGEFLLQEQRPRRQSWAEVVPLSLGDAVIFAVHHRPVQGQRGAYRAQHRHGVSRVRSGERYTLGVIFHDAA